MEPEVGAVEKPEDALNVTTMATTWHRCYQRFLLVEKAATLQQEKTYIETTT